MAGYTLGSDIVFTSSDFSIKPPVTKDLTLNCLLRDNTLAANIPIGKRDLTHTDQDIMYITSILITQNGADVATISEHIPVQLLNNATNLKATGEIKTDQSHAGFLQLDWLYPTDSDAGEYKCDVTAVNKKGHSFTFSTTLEVSNADLTMNDLSSEVSKLKQTMDGVQVEKATMQGQIQTLQGEKTALQGQVKSLQGDRTTMQGQITAMQGQITSLQADKTSMQGQITSLTSEKDSLKSRMSAVEARSLKTRSVTRTNCHWSSWVNGWDATFQYQTPSNTFIAGVHSHHDNHREDRQFDFMYCNLESPHA